MLGFFIAANSFLTAESWGTNAVVKTRFLCKCFLSYQKLIFFWEKQQQPSSLLVHAQEGYVTAVDTQMPKIKKNKYDLSNKQFYSPTEPPVES